MAWYVRVLKGATVLQFAGHCMTAFVLSAPCHPWYLRLPSGEHLCRAPAFACLLAMFELLPRLYGFLVGRAICIGCAREPAPPLPEGVWVFVGNPYPECGVELGHGYPRESGGLVKHFRYVQAPSVGGVFMSALHVLTLLRLDLHIVAGTRKVGTPPYLMPELTKAPRASFADGFLLVPAEARVWMRTTTTVPNVIADHLYLWMHESDPRVPFEDAFIMHGQTTVRGVVSALFATVLVSALAVWTWGGVLFVVLVECLIKYLQGGLVHLVE